MKAFIVSLALAASATVASAQTVTPVTAGGPSFYVGPYAGYMKFGSLRDNAGGSKLSLENGFFYGAQAGYSFSPNISILANLGYTNSKFVNKNPNDLGATNLSTDVGTYLYDGDIQLRLPFANQMGASVAPFVQAGIGQIKYTYNGSRLNEGPDASDTKFTYNAGVGVDLQVTHLIGIRLMAKDYITSLDFEKYYDIDNSTKSKIANNLAFTAGLNFGF